ncbi:MAG: MFS transporter [Pseudomonadota bacterium]
MRGVIVSAWALLLGMGLLMVGNGLQGTLLGVRGGIEGFSTLEMSIVMSAYFAGFLGGSRATPELIRRVGHVRVFAALGSLISAVLILFPVLTDPFSWTVGRAIIGFCFSGVYVTAESWLNNATTKENRGQALSLYMIVQMTGIVAAQGIIGFGDPAGYELFIIPSVLVSLAFAPILLSITPTPAFDTTKPMTLRNLIKISPLGCMGMALLGGVFSAMFGMSAVYGTQAGMTVQQISLFVATLYIGAVVLQYPIGFLSDRMDRRILILATAALGGTAALMAFVVPFSFPVILVASFFIGGTANPLYALLIAYVNDIIDYEDMAAASGGLIFINGLGAISGPLVTGWVMGTVGAEGFFLMLAALLLGLAAYAAYRMTRRASVFKEEDYEAVSYAPLSPSATPVAVTSAQEYYYENAEESGTDETENRDT